MHLLLSLPEITENSCFFVFRILWYQFLRVWNYGVTAQFEQYNKYCYFCLLLGFLTTNVIMTWQGKHRENLAQARLVPSLWLVFNHMFLFYTNQTHVLVIIEDSSLMTVELIFPIKISLYIQILYVWVIHIMNYTGHTGWNNCRNIDLFSELFFF